MPRKMEESMDPFEALAPAVLCIFPLYLCLIIARCSEREWNMRQRDLWTRRISSLFLMSTAAVFALFMFGRPDASMLVIGGLLAIRERLKE